MKKSVLFLSLFTFLNVCHADVNLDNECEEIKHNMNFEKTALNNVKSSKLESVNDIKNTPDSWKFL